jgi:hypothetical protein
MVTTFYNPYERDPVNADSIIASDRIINDFILDLSNLRQNNPTPRNFTVVGKNEAGFTLEVKNEDDHYYNFTTRAFQTTKSNLKAITSSSGSYTGSITFPTVADDDHYDIYLYADLHTKHAAYNEVRFEDGTLDINSSTGSNSSLLQKIIYQYTPVTLTLTGYSVGGTVGGTFGTTAFEFNRGERSAKAAFSFTTTAAATAAYRVLKQPTADDILSFLQPVVGSAPESLPGEDIYPTVTGSGTVNGAVTSGVKVVISEDVASVMKVGDRINTAECVLAGICTHALDTQVVTVVALNPDGDNVKEFSISTAIAIAHGYGLRFSNQKNYQWPVDNTNGILPGMILVPGGNATADSIIAPYEDKVIIFENTVDEKTIIKNLAPAVNTRAKSPTIVDGLVTVQTGSIVFSKQQVLALAGDTLKIGGYGDKNILNVNGYDIVFTDLAITLTPPSTTATESTIGNAVVAVASREGIINNVSRVGGLGINPTLQNPLITSGGGATGSGDITMDAVQQLENTAVLTIENTGRIATITGNMEVIKAGTGNATLRFDVNNLLSTSA